MKKIFLIIALVAFCVAVSAQETKTVEKIRIIEVGNATLSNGQCTVALSNETAADSYYVLITPVGKSAEIYLLKKDSNSFVVKSDDGDSAEFQYFVVEKRKKEILEPGNTKSGK
ncbi:hypothetical protein SDC9_67774 [bioreactor metagenome]|uniref:Uncharacterized protein n=1 Tax=bioreactor metagenome TaxID=1076179 RepID=A0A644XYL8_9ZZZZ